MRVGKKLDQQSCNRAVDHRHIDDEDGQNRNNHYPVHRSWIGNHGECAAAWHRIDGHLGCTIGFSRCQQLVGNQLVDWNGFGRCGAHCICVERQFRICSDERIELCCRNLSGTTDQRITPVMQSNVDLLLESAILRAASAPAETAS